MKARTSHAVHGDHVLVTADIPGEHVTAHEDGTIAVTMQDIEWRQTARAVLKECNAAEHKLPPEAVVQRVRDTLANAALFAADVESIQVARLRFASTVLHRLADMMQGGTICDVEIDWSRDAQHLVHVSFQTERRACELTLELGRGIVQSCGCPPGLLDDRGYPQHVDNCPMGDHA